MFKKNVSGWMAGVGQLRIVKDHKIIHSDREDQCSVVWSQLIQIWHFHPKLGMNESFFLFLDKKSNISFNRWFLFFNNYLFQTQAYVLQNNNFIRVAHINFCNLGVPGKSPPDGLGVAKRDNKLWPLG